MIKRILFTMLVPFAMYLAGAFIGLEVNPLQWVIEGRIFYAIFSIVGSIVMYACPIWYYEQL